MSEGNRMAGAGLINWLLTDPRGEEVGEGLAGGLLAGLPGLAAGQSPGQVALQTAAAIIGGITFGMGGRRVGAWAGNRIHPSELKDQHSMIASLGRALGQETTSEGIGEQLRYMRGNIKDSIVQEQSAGMLRKAASNPAAFEAKYGITAETFTRLHPDVKTGRKMQGVLERIKNMDPSAREKLVERLTRGYRSTENAVTTGARASMDENLTEIANKVRNSEPGSEDAIAADQFKAVFNGDLAEALESMRGGSRPITGKHVGQAVGRILGDEIGVLGGLAAGGALASALGMQSPKDRRIEELERQLRQQQGAS